MMRISNFIQGFGGKQPAVHSDDAQQFRASTDVLPKTRRRLFTKYVALFVAVVCVALLSNGIFDVYFYYQEHKASLIRIQREQAEAAAAKIGQFIKEIESQLGWTTQLPWSAGSIEQRRFDALRLLRQVPAITELAQLDASGKERLRVSRLAMDVVASGTDFSNDPKFMEAVARKVYYGPVYFRRESEPYMTLAIAGTRRDAGVSVAEVNLKLIWDVVSQIKVGERGHAYVVDAQGRLIAHPDISLVLRNTDMSRLAQVRAARGGASGSPSEAVQESENIEGRKVLTAYAPVAPLGWLVFVELPADEAYAPLYAALQRLGLILLAALGFAVLAGMLLAGRMVGPIRALRAGAARIGSGDLSQRIAIKTGDELEALANQFNDMAGRLQESYAGLEQKVEERTREVEEKSRQLEIASQHKSQFLASMSHELRTPLNAIIGLTEMMVTNAARFGTEKAAEPLRRVHRAGSHLLGLINQVARSLQDRSRQARVKSRNGVSRRRLVLAAAERKRISGLPSLARNSGSAICLASIQYDSGPPQGPADPSPAGSGCVNRLRPAVPSWYDSWRHLGGSLPCSTCGGASSSRCSAARRQGGRSRRERSSRRCR